MALKVALAALVKISHVTYFKDRTANFENLPRKWEQQWLYYCNSCEYLGNRLANQINEVKTKQEPMRRLPYIIMENVSLY